jgi:WD40 repeat protein
VRLSRGDWEDSIAPAFSGDGLTAAITDAGGRSVALYRGLPDAEGRRITTPETIRSLALSPDGAMLAIGFETGTIGLWSSDTIGGGPKAHVQAHAAPVAGLQFTSDATRLVSFASGGGGLDRNVAVLSLPRLDDVRPLRARLPNGAATAISVGGGDGSLAIADNDGRILLLDLSALRFVTEFWAGGSWIPALHLDKDSGELIAAGSDGVLRQWTLRPSDWIALACAKANRPLTPEEWSELRPDDSYDPGCAELDGATGREGGGDGRP